MAEDGTFIVDGWMAHSPGGRLHLTGQRCAECATYLWPPAACCKACGGQSLADIELGPEGALWAVTVDWIGSFLGRPNLVGQVCFPEGTFVQGFVVGNVDVPPKIGSPMELIPFEVPNRGGPLITYAFRAMEA